jgi:hypothetical protein
MFFIILLIRPLLPMLGNNYPIIKLFGKSIYPIISIFSIVFLIVLHVDKLKFHKKLLAIITSIVFYCLLIIGIRVLVFGFDTEEILSARGPIIFTLYVLATSILISAYPGRLNFYSKAITISCFFQASVGIFSYGVKNFFPSLNLHFLAPLITNTTGQIRETGTTLNANVYSNFILLGIFIVSFNILKPNNRNKDASIFKELANWGLLLFLTFGVFLSISRFTVFVALIVLFSTVLVHAYNLKKNQLQRKFLFFMVTIGTTATVVGSIVLMNINQLVSGRFASLHFPRIIKIKIGIIQLTSSIENFLIGELGEKIRSFKIDGLVFSDNSFIQISLMYGVPAGLMFFLIIVFHTKNALKSKNHFLTSWIIYITAVFFLTNFIVVESFLLYIPICWFILKESHSPVTTDNFDVLPSYFLKYSSKFPTTTW